MTTSKTIEKLSKLHNRIDLRFEKNGYVARKRNGALMANLQLLILDYGLCLEKLHNEDPEAFRAYCDSLGYDENHTAYDFFC
jgi:hypothetical protein